MKPLAYLSLSIAAAVVPCVSSACPNAVPIENVPPHLETELIDWIAEQTDYDVSNTRTSFPRILTCSVGDSIAYEGRTILVGTDLQGAYSLMDRTIYLVAPWSPDSIEDRGRLLHELVHDVQFQNAYFPCPQAAETEAYDLTEVWLEEHGFAPGFNWFAIYLLARCPRDIHP